MQWCTDHASLLLTLALVALAVASYLAHRSHSARGQAFARDLDEVRAALSIPILQQAARAVQQGGGVEQVAQLAIDGLPVAASTDTRPPPTSIPSDGTSRRGGAEPEVVRAVKTGLVLLAALGLVSGCAPAIARELVPHVMIIVSCIVASAGVVWLALRRRRAHPVPPILAGVRVWLATLSMACAVGAALGACTAGDWRALLERGNRCAVDVAGGAVDDVAEQALSLVDGALEHGQAPGSQAFADAGLTLAAKVGVAALRCAIAMAFDELEHAAPPAAIVSSDPAAWVVGARGKHQHRPVEARHRRHLERLDELARKWSP